MSQVIFEFGDRVRHRDRPEWGIGSVVKVEKVTANGRVSQRLSIRFPNIGLKSLSTEHANLEQVAEEAPEYTGNGEPGVVAAWDRARESGWLAPVAERKIEEAMVSLPMEARDPFSSLRQRLAYTLDLYRFERNGGLLIDWAIAQSGLDDPMTRFNRQELELLFDRWQRELDGHLQRLAAEARTDQAMVREVAGKAPPRGQAALRRISAGR